MQWKLNMDKILEFYLLKWNEFFPHYFHVFVCAWKSSFSNYVQGFSTLSISYVSWNPLTLLNFLLCSVRECEKYVLWKKNFKTLVLHDFVIYWSYPVWVVLNLQLFCLCPVHQHAQYSYSCAHLMHFQYCIVNMVFVVYFLWLFNQRVFLK